MPVEERLATAVLPVLLPTPKLEECGTVPAHLGRAHQCSNIHGCGIILSCHVVRGSMGTTVVTVCGNVLHPPRTRPIQMMMTYQHGMHGLTPGTPMTCTHSLWISIAGDKCCVSLATLKFV